MSRLVYLFTSLGGLGALPEDVGFRWDPEVPAMNASANGLETEGFWYLWKEMLTQKILDEVFIIIESCRGPGLIKWADNFYCRVVPHIDCLETHGWLRPDDVVFARGGFRSWFPILDRMNEQKRWVLFYRAATNRGKWPFWDVVIEDLTDKNFGFEGRLHYKFNKPIHPGIFRFIPRIAREYDVMMHASHIHDKKGQWKGINAAIEYRNIFKTDLKIAMPGGWYGGGQTRAMPRKIQDNKLNVYMPGMISRRELCKLMNQAKLYFHLGGAGQNDRGNLESMCCGVQQIIGNPPYHSPFVFSNPLVATVVKDHSPDKVARVIHDMLKKWTPEIPNMVSDYYQSSNGLAVAVDQMKRLWDFIQIHPVPDRKAALEEFCLQ